MAGADHRRRRDSRRRRAAERLPRRPLPAARRVCPTTGRAPFKFPADSAELLGGDRAPIRNMAAAAVFVVGIVAAGLLVGLFGFLFLVVVVYVVAKAFR